MVTGSLSTTEGGGYGDELWALVRTSSRTSQDGEGLAVKQVGGGPSAGRGSRGDKRDNISKKFTLMGMKVTGRGTRCLGEGSCQMRGEYLSVKGQDPSERRMVGEGQEREVIPGRAGTKEGVRVAQSSQRELGFHPR